MKRGSRSKTLGSGLRHAPFVIGLWRCIPNVLLGLLLCIGATQVTAGPTQYQYDDLGRLIRVVDDNSSTIYQYDSNGNIVSIDRENIASFSLQLFSPTSGRWGTAVSISGSGFSPTPASNSVTIGGVVAVVNSATNSTLTVTVPNGAPTGPIAVTVGGATVTSSQNFVVLKPTVTSFSPVFVNAGAAITVSGSNLNLVPGQTTIVVGSAPATINSITNSQLVFTAPNGSGRVIVATPYGQGISATSLSVLPNAISAANVVSVANAIADGGAQSIVVNQLGKYGLLQFEAISGQMLSVQLSSITTAPSGTAINYQVYSPTSAVIASGTVSATSPSIHLPMAQAAGTYSVVFSSSTATFQLSALLETNASASINGVSLTVTTAVADQSKRFTFSATAGDNLGVGITNLTKVNGSGSYPYVLAYVYKPDGTLWVSNSNCQVANGGCDLNLVNVPTTGVYSVVVLPPNPPSEPNLTMSFTATVSHDLVTALTANAPASVSLSRAGQNGRFTFAGTAGTTVALQIAGVSTTPSGRSVSLTVYKPDGTSLSTTSTATGYTFNLANLPTTGTYTVFVDPWYGASAGLQVTQQ